MSAVNNFFCRPTSICILLFTVFLGYYSAAALKFPGLFNIDSQFNHAATDYIAEHKKIPVVTAEAEGVLFTRLGTTRSLRPPFTFIVSAAVSNLFDDLIENKTSRQRLGSGLIGALTVTIIFLGFLLAFEHIGLALFGAIAIGLLPKFVFLASCNNDDIGAIFSASLLFSSVLALGKYGSKTSVLFFLAISCGLILQSKYTAWLLLPLSGLYCLNLLKADIRKVIRLSPFLLLTAIIAGGWWIIFNLFHYGIGDPSALNHAAKIQYTLSGIAPNQQGYLSTGIGAFELLSNYDNFLFKSYKSFIGYLEWLELEMGWLSYLFYGLIFLIGIVVNISRVRARISSLTSIETICILLLISQCAFYLHHNLARDIQPQARYVLPVIMPLMYLFLSVLKRIPGTALSIKFKKTQWQFPTVTAAALLFSCITVHTTVMANHIVPSYSQQAFHTSLKASVAYPVTDLLKGSSTNALNYSVSETTLNLNRADTGLAALILDPSVCDNLPSIALITMDVTSPTNGGLYLRIDQNNKQRFENLYWSTIAAGNSLASFVISAENCSGMKITLGKGIHLLTISNIRISELRINKYGKPI